MVESNIKLTIVKASLTVDTEVFGKMDPYCIVKYGDKEVKTTTKQQAGQNPEWNETLTLENYNGEDVTIIMEDENPVKDDLIGTLVLKGSQICEGLDGDFDLKTKLGKKGKKAGTLTI